MLGRYALYEKIASGGMASVHIGRLLGPVGFARTVAIKRMHPQFAEDPEFVSMFLDEARLAARIRHPNVVPTLDIVSTDSELFLVMDFVQGESLARLIQSANNAGQHVPPEMVATIMVGVLHGLHAAHEAKNEQGEPLQIVHRDVSPHNVLVGTDGVARVLDFGVAKAAGRAQTTRDGQMKGKVAYMAPEQIRGSVSRATDVYAASVVLWEALTGKRLFRGDSEAEVIDKVLRGNDVLPSTQAPGIPTALDKVTMRGLSLNSSARFGNAREMARALEEAVGLVTPSKIGDWVEAFAKEAIDRRMARIARIESESSLYSAAAGEVPSSPSLISGSGPIGLAQLARKPPVEPPPASVRSEVVILPSSGSMAALGGTSFFHTRPRTTFAAVGAALGLLLAGAVAVGKGIGDRDAAAQAPPPAPSALAAAPVASAPTPEPSASSAASPPDTASASASSRPTPAPPGTGIDRPTLSSPKPPTQPRVPWKRWTPQVSCDPPFTINAAGHRVPKPECP